MLLVVMLSLETMAEQKTSDGCKKNGRNRFDRWCTHGPIMPKLHVAQKQHAYIQIIRYEQRSKIDLALNPLSRFVPSLVVYPEKIVCVTVVVN